MAELGFGEWEYHSRRQKMAGAIVFFIGMPVFMLLTLPRYLGLYLFGIGFIAVTPYLFNLITTQRLPKKMRALLVSGIVLLTFATMFHFNWMSMKSTTYSISPSYQAKTSTANTLRECIRKDLDCDYERIIGISPPFAITDYCTSGELNVLDEDDNCVVSDTELLKAIDVWEQGDLSDKCLLNGINAWEGGEIPGCGTTTTTTLYHCSAICTSNGYDWGESCSARDLSPGTKEVINNKCCCGYTTTTTIPTTTTCPSIPPGRWCPGQEGEVLCPQRTDEQGCPVWRCNLCSTTTTTLPPKPPRDYTPYIFGGLFVLILGGVIYYFKFRK